MSPILAAIAGAAVTGVAILFVKLAREAWRNRKADRRDQAAIRRITGEYPTVRRPASPIPPPWLTATSLDQIPRPAATVRGVASVAGDWLEPQWIDPPTGRHHPGGMRPIVAEATDAYNRIVLYGRRFAQGLDVKPTEPVDDPLWFTGSRELPAHHARGAR